MNVFGKNVRKACRQTERLITVGMYLLIEAMNIWYNRQKDLQTVNKQITIQIDRYKKDQG